MQKLTLCVNAETQFMWEQEKVEAWMNPHGETQRCCSLIFV